MENTPELTEEQESQHVFSRTDFATNYIDTGELAYLLQFLEPHPPITEAYIVLNGQKNHVWWSSQREHLIAYFGSRNSYRLGDMDEPDPSAENAFAHMKRPEMFLYLFEALGETTDVVEETARQIARAGDYHAQLKCTRELITWPRIVELARAKVASLLEQAKLLKAVSYLIR